MAFFDEEIEKLSKRNPPKSLQDCLQPDTVSQRLWEWAQNIENWGRVILVLMLIVGVADTYFAWIGTSQLDELLYSADNSTRFLSAIGTALQWIFYAFIEYCVYHAIALLMCALASIVQSNRITSDIAAYDIRVKLNSMDKDDPLFQKERAEEEAEKQRMQQEAEIKEKERIEALEKFRRFERYWAEHAEDRKSLIEKKKEAEEKLQQISPLAVDERKALQELIKAIEEELEKDR